MFLLLPIHDDAPRKRSPLVVPLLLAINLLVYIEAIHIRMSDPEHMQTLFQDQGLVPDVFLSWWRLAFDNPASLGDQWIEFLRWGVYPLFSYQFLHAGVAHLAGNMLFLWTFGDNVEDRLGRFGFLLFYLLSGVLAVLTHCLIDPTSQVPIVGASGSISGVMGAYLLLFPRARVLLLVWIVIFVTFVRVSAWLLLIPYFALQFPAVQRLFSLGETQGVAVWAHIGGFLAGMALGPFFVWIRTRSQQAGPQKKSG